MGCEEHVLNRPADVDDGDARGAAAAGQGAINAAGRTEPVILSPPLDVSAEILAGTEGSERLPIA